MKSKNAIINVAALFFVLVVQSVKAQTNTLARPAWEERLHSIGQLCQVGDTVVLGRVKSKTDTIVMENCRGLRGARVTPGIEFDSVLVASGQRYEIDMYPRISEGDTLLIFGLAVPIERPIPFDHMLHNIRSENEAESVAIIRKKLYPIPRAGVIKLEAAEAEEIGMVVQKYWDHLHNPAFDLKTYQQFLAEGLAHSNVLVRKNADIDLQNSIMGSDIASLQEMISESSLPEDYRNFAARELEYKLKRLQPPPTPQKDIKANTSTFD